MDDEKIFTQAELNEKIESRLARQKAKFEDESLADRVELETLRKDQIARKKADEAALLAEIEAASKTVDPAVLALLPDELPPDKQLAWLRKASGELPANKAKTPVTPLGKQTDKKFEPYPVKRRLV